MPKNDDDRTTEARLRDVVGILVAALDDASSVVDAGEDEAYAYAAELELGRAVLAETEARSAGLGAQGTHTTHGEPKTPRFSAAERYDIVSRALSVIETSDGADEHDELIPELRALVAQLEGE